ncbi:NADH-quinone oxidoreductase subunit A [Streptomyces iconiensis]|uniref:NADH-quinone oxidoreductase subunit n=1 Tax=Streptomyces iconiensis TaxID=1384038 RepID=A0ABT7A9C8_9ACTN|nr:NADH-quinone oxidoreductase subunit A [Streptomyces iconiensis]MDJ1137956.1 NADH-quinone oxidoreductase subunit A [Streptomyces iconiensis]
MLALLGVGVAALVVLHGAGALLSRRRLGTAEVRGAEHAPPVGPFTGGAPPAAHAFSRFHVRWYAVAMIFLAFDMEMLFMYPWVRVVAETGTTAVVEMFLFLGILFAGVTYAWREGALRWS